MTDLQIGDQVTIEWGPGRGHSYGVNEDRGTVERIGDQFVSIRHPAGYQFTVAKYDLISGTKIKIKKRDAND